MQRKYVFLLLSAVLLLLLVVILLLRSVEKQNEPTKNTPSPSPTPMQKLPTELLPDVNEEYKSNFDKNIQTEAAFHEQESHTIDLIKAMPQTGARFFVDYDFSTNTFYLVLQKDTKDAGEKEFDELLQRYAVNRSDITVFTRIQ